MYHSINTCILERECNETDVRLVGAKYTNGTITSCEITEKDRICVSGDIVHSGYVEVCLRGHWGSVCNDQWDPDDATVVCRQLGYNGCEYIELFYKN